MNSKFINQSSIYIAVYIAGLILWIYMSNIGLVSDTLISLEIMLLVFLSLTVIGTIITWLIFRKFMSQMTILGHVMLHILVTNSVFWFVVMKLNYHNYGSVDKLILPILGKGFTGRQHHHDRKPIAIIEIEGQETEIKFGQEVKLDSAKTLELTIAKGLFGYKVILEKKIGY